jgi:hypothetical protein
LWFESEPLWTRQRSSPVENGCAPSVVTRLSVAIRVWPSPWVADSDGSPKRSTNPRGSPVSLKISIRVPALMIRSCGCSARIRASTSAASPSRTTTAWLARTVTSPPSAPQSSSGSSENSDSLVEPIGAGSR